MRKSVFATMVGLSLLLGPKAFAAEISFCPTLGGGRMRTSVESLLERRWKHVVRQSLDISCGSAALATILQHHFGDQVSEVTLIRAIHQHINPEDVRKRGGFSLLDLKKVVSALGYRVKGYKITVEQLKGIKPPALVPVTIRGYKHFIVFRGMVQDRVVIADPSFGNTQVDLPTFASLWQGIALVIEKEGTKQLPQRLRINVRDVQVGEQPGGLRALNHQPALQPLIRYDEF